MVINSIAQIIEGRELPFTVPDVSVKDACFSLQRWNVGALAVLDGERLAGVLSERDVIRKCICQSRMTADTPVRDVMTPDPITVSLSDTLPHALGLMARGRFRHLPVIDGARVVGLLSIRDIPTEYHLMFERYAEYVKLPA
jgi:CBS domain-containing protein